MKMGPGFIYTLLITGLICLFIFSEQPSEQDKSASAFNRRHLAGARRHNGARNAKHEPVAFDPLIEEAGRRREDRQWEREYWTHQYRTWATQAQHWISHPNLGDHPPPEQQIPNEVPHAPEAEAQPNPWDNFNYSEYADSSEEFIGEDYLDIDHFNISHRLEVLFPLIDVNPRDGWVSLPELQFWHELSALRSTYHRTGRDLEVYDLNHDGLITFAEYLPHLSSLETEQASLEVGGAGWWREQFDNADENGDGILNHTEFHEFLHPEDSLSVKIHQWLVRQELKIRTNGERDKLTWEDFHKNVFDVIRDYGAEESAPELVHLNPYRDMEARKQILSKAKFDEYDINKDGFITEDEAEHFIDKLRPGELHYARLQAQHLMTEADDNKDNHLSLEEMLAHPYVFYSTAYDHGEDSYAHDEFR